MIELLVEDGYEYEDDGARVTTYRPASPSEVVAAARQLEGAEVINRYDVLPDGEIVVVGQKLVIPLGIEGEEGT